VYSHTQYKIIFCVRTSMFSLLSSYVVSFWVGCLLHKNREAKNGCLDTKFNFTLYLIVRCTHCILIIFQLYFTYNPTVIIFVIISITTVVTMRYFWVETSLYVTPWRWSVSLVETCLRCNYKWKAVLCNKSVSILCEQHSCTENVKYKNTYECQVRWGCSCHLLLTTL
jgi:hypothetical protein